MSTETSSPYPANSTPHVRHAHVVPRMSPPHKFLEDKSGVDIKWDVANLAPRDLVFVRNCTNVTLTLATPCAKLLIESCENLTINAPEKIRTNMIEVWNSKNVTIYIGQEIFTAQVDMCQDVILEFAGKEEYQQAVWSNCHRLAVNFRNAPEHNTVTGLDEMRKIYPDVNDTVDQFFLRFVNGVLTPEILIRLPGGFPSTHREADQWDAEHPHDVKLF